MDLLLRSVGFACGHLGCLLWSVVGAGAANMRLDQCKFGVPIFFACATWSASPEPRALGRSKAGDQVGRCLESVSSAGMMHGRVDVEVWCGIMGMRRADAIIACLAELRRVGFAPQVGSHVARPPIVGQTVYGAVF